MDHGTYRQIRASKRAWVAIILTVLITTVVWLLWLRKFGQPPAFRSGASSVC